MKPIAPTFALLMMVASPALAQDHGADFIANWDMDGSGVVSVADIAAKRADLFAMFDSDSDGWLKDAEWQEIATFIADQQDVKKAEGKGQGQAQHGNGKGNGWMQMLGLGGTGAGFGAGNGPGTAIHESLSLSYNDADKDGAVSLDEFTATAGTLFQALDRNADGLVDGDDIGRQ